MRIINFLKNFALAATMCAGALTITSSAEAKDTLRFAVGPYMPQPTDSKKAFEPLVKHIADELGVDYTLVATTDWAGLAVAFSAGQLDVALMGPWGFTLAHNAAQTQAVAAMEYKGKATYHSILVAKADSPINKFPEDAKGKQLTLGDNGSTTGYLLPSFWFKNNNIDPKSYFKYRDGVAQAAGLVSVANGLSDLFATCDYCLETYVAAGAVPKDALKIVWKSDAVPTDPIAARKDLDPEMVAKLRTVVTSLTEEQAKKLLPTNYTGFAAAQTSDYRVFEDAGRAVGLLKPASN